MTTTHGTTGDSEPHNGLTRRTFVRVATVGASVALATTTLPLPDAAAASRPQCAATEEGGPIQVTPDCDDPTYNQPVVDSEQDLTTPMRHRKVEGHFEGTDKKFTLYLPAKAQWQGRFFHKVYPLDDPEFTDDTVAFGAASGAYTVHTNGGGGYRVDAAAAKFSRTYAARYYGTSRRIRGYLYGGSGGSYQAIGAMENTTGVWDGAVPFIPGTPASIPNSFTVRALARLVLRDKGPQIADAVAPGGNGDPYAGLTSVERDMLREATKMGVPLRAWEDYRYVLGLSAPDGLLGFTAVLRAMDPTYADDFWGQPGYLGTERSALGDLVRAARIDHTASVESINRNDAGRPTSIVLETVPSQPDTKGVDFTLYAKDGTTRIGTLTGSLEPAKRLLTLDGQNDAKVLDALADGEKVGMDNRWSLAFRAYHRHQIPTRSDFYAWDQYKGADGKPLYPQRSVQIGPAISASTAGGGTHTGRINGKMIIVANLCDTDAYVWPADWYSTQVKRALGTRYGDSFRLWYNDNADHLEAPPTGAKAARIVEFTSIVERALRELSAWVEKGVAPARSTPYTISDSQVTVPTSATARRGIQPVVDLTVGGTDHIEVLVGRPVAFSATVEVPPHAGRVVRTEWDFTGSGTFTTKRFGNPSARVEARQSFTYSEPGTYFAAVRATAQREDAAGTHYAQVANLGRMRVVVRRA
ncbi:PKD domain-containing protein [Streptomyces sp. NPDC005373]|uniref:PKD domain-containing protein n=1 Tax=Streptomyces sp. NPDC005373 TaxID=3156879 RepID=UPI0033A48A97